MNSPGTERRAAPRRACPDGRSVRLGIGATGALLDLSPGGLAAEFPVRLLPGTEARVFVHGSGGSARVPARVVWCRVNRITPSGVTYRAGLAFAGSHEPSG